MLVICGACTADDAVNAVDASGDTSSSGGGFDVGAILIDGSLQFWDSHAEPPWGDAPDAMPPMPHVPCGPRTTTKDDVGHAEVDSDSGLEVCPLPASQCADPHWLVYFTSGTCVEGTCFFEEAALHCPAGCENGGCRPQSTAK